MNKQTIETVNLKKKNSNADLKYIYIYIYNREKIFTLYII